jgi:hypothetical protein
VSDNSDLSVFGYFIAVKRQRGEELKAEIQAKKPSGISIWKIRLEYPSGKMPSGISIWKIRAVNHLEYWLRPFFIWKNFQPWR